MTFGEMEFAIRQALNNFDRWNDVTGFVSKGTSYYYEVQGVIEDAVRIGAKIAIEGVDCELSDIHKGDDTE
jgi:hypothetical protein